MSLRELIDEYAANSEMLVMDGYEDCIAGIVERYGQDPIVCYSKERVLAKMVDEGMEDEQEALEFYEFNQLGAWMGDGTPCFLVTS